MGIVKSLEGKSYRGTIIQYFSHNTEVIFAQQEAV